MHMAELVKWLTHWFVAPALVGSIPTLRPIKKIARTIKLEFLYNKLYNWYDKDDKYIDAYDGNVLNDDYIEELDLSKEKDDFER